MTLENLTALATDTKSLTHQQDHADTVFPYAVHCVTASASVEDACRWTKQHRSELLDLGTTHGAVLFRDFPLNSVEDFDALVGCLDLANFPYDQSLSNAVRINRTPRVFSSNEAPPDVQIFFHHEMAQTPLYPKWILFYCEIAAESGGATPICRSDILYARLATECADFIATCEQQGLKYSNVMPASNDPESGMGRSWQSTLSVTSRTDAEDRLAELGYTWEWLQDDSLRVTSPPLPAVMEVSPGRKTFFNQLIAAFSGWKDSRNDPSKSIRHGDDSPLDVQAVETAIAVADDLSFDVDWQTGDAVLIDNTIAMHARKPFAGTRKVVASLGNMQTQRFEVTNR